ncbi:MAG: hypothetical protein L3J71_00055 [Victivallaceae bacterium]|nr:hypothetical protein [Victivallaceae bacterium]
MGNNKLLHPEQSGEEHDIGIAMMGSVAFALFGENIDNLKPEEVYALHCAWELEMNEDKRAPAERTVNSGLEILLKYNPTL